MKKSFTLIELLIVLAVIAALIAAIIPTGIYAIKKAKATTVALNLSEISQIAIQEFYLSHNDSITINDIKPYFSTGESKILKNYSVKTVMGATVDHVYIWYNGIDVSASMVRKIFHPVVSTDDDKPMLIMTVKKYW